MGVPGVPEAPWRVPGPGLALGLVLAPLFLGGVEVGKRLFPLAPEALFRRLAFGLIFFAALSGLPLWD